MLANDINDQIDAGRRTMEEAEAEAEMAETGRQMPSAGVMFGVGMAIIGLGVLGWMIYRSRRRETFVRQIAAALPASMDDLREEIGARWKRVRSR
jgi:uncharacterized iron-regulated membrane protein